VKSKIDELKQKRKTKYMEYAKTPYNSWLKQLKKYELDILDTLIRIENLKRQNEI
jgi:hypothetical protein